MTAERQDPEKKDRTEPEGTIPKDNDGVGLTTSDEPNTCETEEDPGQGSEHAREKRQTPSEGKDSRASDARG